MKSNLFYFTENENKINVVALLVLLAMCLIHILATWGHTDFWGDAGRWRHEVERFAEAEVLYQDFSWPAPPAAMWILGTIARTFGSDVHVLWVATSIGSVANSEIVRNHTSFQSVPG